MKKLILPIVLLCIIACNSKQGGESTEANPAVVNNFLADVESFEDIEDKTPITYFEEQAKQMATEVIDFSDDNIADVLETAKSYAHCVIIVEDHTIIKIEDIEDCKQSGSWGACMPIAKGYIKRGDLDYQEDYINNIIGTPDSQTRTAFMFN